MEDKERFELLLLRFQQIDKRMDSLEQILNTLFFKILVSENMIKEISNRSKFPIPKKSMEELHVSAQKNAAKEMGRIKAQIELKLQDNEVPIHKRYMNLH